MENPTDSDLEAQTKPGAEAHESEALALDVKPDTKSDAKPEPSHVEAPAALVQPRAVVRVLSDQTVYSSTDSDSSEGGVLATPFKPRAAVDFAATQSLTRQRILQSSGYDTARLQTIELAHETPLAKPSRASPSRAAAPSRRRQPAESIHSSSTESSRRRQRNRTRGSRRQSLKKSRANTARLEDQARETVYDNGWTETSLGLMENWFNMCEKAAKDHTVAAIAARKKHVRVSLPSIVVGSAATGLAFFSVGDDETDTSRTASTSISVALAVLTSALSVLGGLNSLFSLSTRQSLHTTAASNFQNLARKIQLTLFLPVSLRSKCDLILTDVSAEYFSIVEQSPMIYNGW